MCGSHAFEAKPAVGGRWVFVPNEADPGQEPNLPRVPAVNMRSGMTMDAPPGTISLPRSSPNDPHLRPSDQDLPRDSGFGLASIPFQHGVPWQPSLQRQTRSPPTPSSSSAPSEFAESESRTDDPVVGPYQPIGPPRRRRRRNGVRLENGPMQIPDYPLNLPGMPMAQATPPRTPVRPAEGLVDRSQLRPRLLLPLLRGHGICVEGTDAWCEVSWRTTSNCPDWAL